MARLRRTATRAFVDDPLLRWFYLGDDEYWASAGFVFDNIIRRSLALNGVYTTDDGVAQRQGLGAAVMAPVAAVCRAEGLPMYLETATAANVAYYTHLGFHVRSEFDIPDGPHLWCMLRHP